MENEGCRAGWRPGIIERKLTTTRAVLGPKVVLAWHHITSISMSWPRASFSTRSKLTQSSPCGIRAREVNLSSHRRVDSSHHRGAAHAGYMPLVPRMIRRAA
jgi:hypothetical protein